MDELAIFTILRRRLNENELLELFIKDYWCISLASSFQFSRTETLSRDSRTILGLEFLHDSHLICEYPKEDPAVESGIQKRESRTGCIVAEVVAVVGIVATEAVTVVPAADIKEAIDRSSGGGGSGRDGEWLCANPSCGTFQ